MGGKKKENGDYFCKRLSVLHFIQSIRKLEQFFATVQKFGRKG